MRAAGYHFDRHAQQDNKMSFVRSLGRGDFPRFHAYVIQETDVIHISLHLDQKRPSYQGSHAHSGEYDSDLVEQEVLRLRKVAKVE